MELQKILDKLGVTALNDMQTSVLQAARSSKSDLVLLSPTGSGKTLAYLLSLTPFINASSEEVQMIVIVPGRELALQSERVLKDMGTGLRCTSVYGGRPTMDEHKVIRQMRPQVVFGTPGRLNDHIDKGNIDAKSIAYVVIDEFDKCLNMGFQEEMSRLLGSLPHIKRNFLLSATDSEEIANFMNPSRTHRLDFTLESEKPSDRIAFYLVKSPDKDKLQTLGQLLRSRGNESSIVFLNYRDSVERTSAFLKDNGFTVSVLHGGMEQRLREDALYRFSNGSANVLVATDLASRGLDISDVANVIQYHLPLDADSHVHRVGRTARWQAGGNTFFILSNEEQLPPFVKEQPEGYDIPEELPLPARPKMVTLYIGKGKKDKISKGDIVGFLCKTGGLNQSDIGRIDVKDRYAYAAVSIKRYKEVLKKASGEKIKGIKTIVELIK